MRLHSWTLRFYNASTMFQPSQGAADAHLQRVLSEAAAGAGGEEVPTMQQLMSSGGVLKGGGGGARQQARQWHSVPVPPCVPMVGD